MEFILVFMVSSRNADEFRIAKLPTENSVGVVCRIIAKFTTCFCEGWGEGTVLHLFRTACITIAGVYFAIALLLRFASSDGFCVHEPGTVLKFPHLNLFLTHWLTRAKSVNLFYISCPSQTFVLSVDAGWGLQTYYNVAWYWNTCRSHQSRLLPPPNDYSRL